MNAVAHVLPHISEATAPAYTEYTVNAYHKDADMNQQIIHVTVGGLAMELLEMLKPALPTCEMYISRRDGVTSGFVAAQALTAKVKDLVIWLRGVDDPGNTFMHVIGWRGNPRETGFFYGWSVNDIGAKWRRLTGFVGCHTVMSKFGEFGPFPSAQVMSDVIDRLDVRFPDAILFTRKRGLAADLVSDAELDAEYVKTLEKLAALGA